MSYALSIDDDVMLLAELSCMSYSLDECLKVVAVSYTHLDVYKRQAEPLNLSVISFFSSINGPSTRTSIIDKSSSVYLSLIHI